MFNEMLKEEINKQKVLTENDAVAYLTSGKELLDFNFMLTTLRSKTIQEIKREYAKVYFEDPKTAIKYAFYVGDIRGGLGERKIFRACIEWLAEHHPEVMKEVFEYIPHYTRWDNLLRLVNVGNKELTDLIVELVDFQMQQDFNGQIKDKPISLLAKWMPSENASSKETKQLARKLQKLLRVDAKTYRKTLSRLRKHIDVVERKMSTNKWGAIDYEAVPSKANLIYNNAFLRNDSVRRSKYLDALEQGKAKINAKVLQPHEIVNKYTPGYSGYPIKLDKTYELLWKNLPNLVLEDSIIVRDGSGSMLVPVGDWKTRAIDVATALAIYISERCSDQWKDKFITFSSNPKFVDMSRCKSLRDKLQICCSHTDMSNTDIKKVMDMILKTAVNNKLTQEDMPKNIVIISDMQFDGYNVNAFNWDETLFETISKQYEDNGYKIPRIVFWNLDAHDRKAIPMQKNELGMILCSGFSIQNMNMIISGEIDPLKALLAEVNGERYDLIEDRIKWL